jgi:drug/metabolite transporter (DMT)-like permease
MATIGIGLLYKGEDGATLSIIGTILVIISALTYAIYIVGINRTRLKEMNTIKVTFYVLLFGWFLFAVQCFTNYGIQTPPTEKWYLWGNLLALGLLPTAISLLTTTIAIQLIGSTPTAILGALEPATAIFFGITVFNETLTIRETCGLVLIIAAVCIVVMARNKKTS